MFSIRTLKSQSLFVINLSLKYTFTLQL